MKIACLILVFFCSTTVVFAQSSVTENSAKVLAPVKPVEPAISSIKASTKPVAVVKAIRDDNSGSVAPIQATKIIVKPTDNTGSVAPVAAIQVATKPVLPNTVNSTNTGLTIPVAEKQSNMSNGSNSTNTTVKPVDIPALPVENAKINQVQPINVAGKPLASMTVGINTELVKDVVPTTANTTLPEVKLDNSKQVKIEEVPQSVANPAVKAPVVSTQSNEKPKVKTKE